MSRYLQSFFFFKRTQLPLIISISLSVIDLTRVIHLHWWLLPHQRSSRVAWLPQVFCTCCMRWILHCKTFVFKGLELKFDTAQPCIYHTSSYIKKWSQTSFEWWQNKCTSQFESPLWSCDRNQVAVEQVGPWLAVIQIKPVLLTALTARRLFRG